MSSSCILTYVEQHQTTIALTVAWLFSAICSSQPPLDASAGYYRTWMHNVIQTIAANPSKLRLPPIEKPEIKA